MAWTLYILQCADKTFYTGITTDLANRLAMHTKGTGAKYLRGRAPYRIVRTELYETQSDALKREAQIKAMRRERKHRLVCENLCDKRLQPS